MVPGTSKPSASRICLPAWRHSVRASSSATAASSAANRCINVNRSAGVAPDHAGKADFAAATASLPRGLHAGRHLGPPDIKPETATTWAVIHSLLS